MKRLPVVLAALVLGASLASAHAIDLTVGDCVNAQPASPHAVTFDCSSNGSPGVDLVASVELSAPVPQFVYGAVIIDFASSVTTLPDWWRFDSPRGCHLGGYATGVFGQPTDGACTSLAYPAIAGGQQVLSVEQWQYLYGGGNRIRYNGGFAFATPVDLPLLDPVNGSNEWGVCRLHFSFADKTVGPNACAGCSAGVCVVLNDVQLASSGDTAPGNNYVPGAGGQWVTINAGSPSCPAATPTHNSTWGAIKAQYR